jgi:hypothetical protein
VGIICPLTRCPNLQGFRIGAPKGWPLGNAACQSWIYRAAFAQVVTGPTRAWIMTRRDGALIADLPVPAVNAPLIAHHPPSLFKISDARWIASACVAAVALARRILGLVMAMYRRRTASPAYDDNGVATEGGPLRLMRYPIDMHGPRSRRVVRGVQGDVGSVSFYLMAVGESAAAESEADHAGRGRRRRERSAHAGVQLEPWHVRRVLSLNADRRRPLADGAYSAGSCLVGRTSGESAHRP